jgi:hypothetical protein
MPPYVPGWRGDDDHTTPLKHWVYPVKPGHTAAHTPKLAALVDWLTDWIARQEAQDGSAGHAKPMIRCWQSSWLLRCRDLPSWSARG